MGGGDPIRDHTEMPEIPTFFSAEDLPSWLRDDPEAPAPPAVRETRARVAWAVMDVSAAPERETPFRAAADATWNLLTTPPRHAKRGRRDGPH